MSNGAAYTAFENATEKQIEAIDLAAEGMTSKQIAIELGVVPRTVDQRIDAVRIKLDGISRNDMVRQYRAWKAMYGLTTYDPIPLAHSIPDPAQEASQPETMFLFGDSLSFDGRSAWDSRSPWLRPEIKPSDLGSGARLLFILVGAVAILAGVVLTAAFSNALTELLTS